MLVQSVEVTGHERAPCCPFPLQSAPFSCETRYILSNLVGMADSVDAQSTAESQQEQNVEEQIVETMKLHVKLPNTDDVTIEVRLNVPQII